MVLDNFGETTLDNFADFDEMEIFEVVAGWVSSSKISILYVLDTYVFSS